MREEIQTYIYEALVKSRIQNAESKTSSAVSVASSTFLEHLNSPPVFSGVPVTRSLVLCVCFVDRFFFFFVSSNFFQNTELLIPNYRT